MSRFFLSCGLMMWPLLLIPVGVVGLVDMARSIQRAGGVSAGLAWGGVGVSLVTLLFGLLVCLLSAVLWLLLNASAPGGSAGDAAP